MLLCCVVCHAADGSSAGRDPEASDLGRLPLLSAVIKEALRVCPPAPFGGSRICPVDGVDMCGYKVDKVGGAS
jgi:cytochrome P450